MSYMDKETMRFVDKGETEKFMKLSDQWWDEQGAFKTLHLINPLRIDYIQKMSQQYLGKSVHDLKILDIGCGGGLICEPLARLGAKVTGVDANEAGIEAAKIHCQEMGLDIDYRCIDIHDMVADYKEYYDIVINCEVVEHVRHPQEFMQTSATLLQYDGIMIAATLNRTIESYVKAIIGAEYILGWLPKGTHDWHKFLKPSELVNFMRTHDMILQDSVGLIYNIFANQWLLRANNLNVNYMLCLQRIRQH